MRRAIGADPIAHRGGARVRRPARPERQASRGARRRPPRGSRPRPATAGPATDASDGPVRRPASSATAASRTRSRPRPARRLIGARRLRRGEPRPPRPAEGRGRRRAPRPPRGPSGARTRRPPDTPASASAGSEGGQELRRRMERGRDEREQNRQRRRATAERLPENGMPAAPAPQRRRRSRPRTCSARRSRGPRTAGKAVWRESGSEGSRRRPPGNGPPREPPNARARPGRAPRPPPAKAGVRERAAASRAPPPPGTGAREEHEADREPAEEQDQDDQEKDHATANSKAARGICVG